MKVKHFHFYNLVTVCLCENVPEELCTMKVEHFHFYNLVTVCLCENVPEELCTLMEEEEDYASEPF